ncbi:MAG TPA: cobaltochelatase subunit CobT, partial [Sphingomicrobium sp.]
MAEPIDLFRRALAGAARAIARDPEVEVVFASETAPASGKTARVPSPGASLQARLVAEARGAADSLALRLRYHDDRLHAAAAPLDLDSRAVFDALETARFEALGARVMKGVGDNLAELTESRVRGDAILRARSADEVPLATAIGLLARQRLTGASPPESARAGLELIAPWIEEKAGKELDALGLTIDDQAAFAKLSRRLLEDLDLSATAEDSDEPPETGGEDEEGEDGGGEDGGDDSESGASKERAEMRAEQVEEEGEGDTSPQDMELGEDEMTGGDETTETALSAPARRNWDLSPQTDYKPFTMRF